MHLGNLKSTGRFEFNEKNKANTDFSDSKNLERSEALLSATYLSDDMRVSMFLGAWVLLM